MKVKRNWPGEGGHGGAPGGVLQVGAQTIVATVLAGSALDVGEEGRAHLADQSLGGVDQGQTLLDIFIAQAITEIIIFGQKKNDTPKYEEFL